MPPVAGPPPARRAAGLLGYLRSCRDLIAEPALRVNVPGCQPVVPDSHASARPWSAAAAALLWPGSPDREVDPLPQDRLELVVTEARPVAEGVRCYTLADPGGAALPPFEAGAHLDVHLANGLVRQYSLCNQPGETHRYVIAVLRETAGRGGSAAVHDGLTVGGRVAVSRPRNFFPVVREARRHLLLAGGTKRLRCCGRDKTFD